MENIYETKQYFISIIGSCIRENKEENCEKFDSITKAREYFEDNIDYYKDLYGDNVRDRAIIIEKKCTTTRAADIGDFKYILKSETTGLYVSKIKITRSDNTEEYIPYFTCLISEAKNNLSFESVSDAMFHLNNYSLIYKKYYKDEIVDSIKPVLCRYCKECK